MNNKFLNIMKYGATRVEVDIDGSLSYPEPQNEAKGNISLLQNIESICIRYCTNNVNLFLLLIL